MTTERKANGQSKFISAVLPWIIAASGLAVYLVTLNYWVSFNSLLQVSRLSGWTWQPELGGPLPWLLTYPLRWLPEALIPAALSVFSAVCAALTLALLARSVALLPHDRTQQQRERERSPSALLSIPAAWLPPVLAALVCGLQLTFWEHATTGSGLSTDLVLSPYSNRCEMLDLLLLAYVIRCLLEFRVSRRESWLAKAAIVYGLSMTGNWAMTGFLPLFVGALIWSKGLDFFNLRFLTRMALLGLAGLSLCLLLPAVQCFAEISRVPFLPGLKMEFGLQKASLQAAHVFLSSSKQTALLLALTSVIPVLLLSIRWTSYFGDNSPMGVKLTSFVFHVVSGVFLAICTWVALDPPFSPRNVHIMWPCLSLLYLGALSVGYFSGYFLLLCGAWPRRSPPSPMVRLVNRGIKLAIWLLLLATPVLLVYRNLPQIRIANGPLLRNYAILQAQSLPASGAILLSDDALRLGILHTLLAQTGRDKDYLFLDTASMASPEYHRYLKKVYGPRWPVEIPKGLWRPIADMKLLQLVMTLAKSTSIYYLHPSFGYYFEVFYPEPHGLLYKLDLYPTNTLLQPLPRKEIVAENEAFWSSADPQMLRPLARAVAAAAPSGPPGVMDRILLAAQLQPMPNHTASVLGNFYSRALDAWGVELQRAGDLAKAAAHFQRALDLYPNNVAAQANLDYNRSLQAGSKEPPALAKMVQERLGLYRRGDQILNDNGPFDEPTLTFQDGLWFEEGKFYRQAATEFARVRTMTPSRLDARLWLAKMDLILEAPDQAIKVLDEIHAQPDVVGLNQTNMPDLLQVEMTAHLAKGDVAAANALAQAALLKYPGDTRLLATAARAYLNYGVFSNAVQEVRAALERQPQDDRLLVTAVRAYHGAGMHSNAVASIRTLLAKHPGDTNLLPMATQVFIGAGYYSNALDTIAQELAVNPNNPQVLVNKGYTCLQTGDYAQAIPSLTRAIDMASNNAPVLLALSARLNRAIAYLRSEKLDEAQQDYEALTHAYPSAYQAYFGLLEIADRRKNTNAAIQWCRLYLTNAPPNTAEAKQVLKRLEQLQPDRH